MVNIRLVVCLLVTLHASATTSCTSDEGRSAALNNHDSSSCDLSTTERTDCYPEGNKTDCIKIGCCWRENNSINSIPWCFFPNTQPPLPQCQVPDEERIDCLINARHPKSCIDKGCCWWKGSGNGIPFCFYSKNADKGYSVISSKPVENGFQLNLRRSKPSRWPKDISNLRVDAFYEKDSRFHFKIYDPNNKRYEVPLEVEMVASRATSPQYDILLERAPYAMKVVRRSTGTVLFNTEKTQLTFADQFLEISTTLPTRYVYGLGEHQGPFLHDATKPQKYTFWAHDQPVQTGANLYGSHPFVLAMEEDGNAYGIFLLNSNALEVDIDPGSPPVMTFRTIGGIFDFYIFTGPTPDSVVAQYNDLIGHPFMPPYWALGYHLCRWGYSDSKKLKDVISRMRDGKFPQDVQWNDLDYMDQKRDWTYDQKRYGDLPQIVDDLHQHGQHYIMLVDPGINNKTGYGPYDDGLELDIFIKTHNGSKPLFGKVWPGVTAYPDFTHPNAERYWAKQASNYHSQVKYDGMWLDMNEPSNFGFGSIHGCPISPLNTPPYVPPIQGQLLYEKTICPSAKQFLSSHYNLHNMYGFFEVKTSYRLFTTLRNKRTLIISRSTYPGLGRYGGHWTGDIFSTWDYLRFVIPALLNFNMFGIPFVGSDICGFIGNTEEELCIRWTQLGAFSPFMRNHNDRPWKDQDPASPNFSQTGRDKMRYAIQLRYTFIPYLYTLLYISHKDGIGVVRPLFFQYPKDIQSYSIDRQFMWGDSLLITPVVDEGYVYVDAYFPKDVWYDYYSGAKINSSGVVRLPAPLGHINVHIRGGSVVPAQNAALTTTESRKNQFGLTIALPDESNFKPGDNFERFMYWDDGETLLENDTDIGNIINFNVARNISGTMLSGTQPIHKYKTSMILGHLRVFGVTSMPTHVTVNERSIAFHYHDITKELQINSINISLLSNFKIGWDTPTM